MTGVQVDGVTWRQIVRHQLAGYLLLFLLLLSACAAPTSGTPVASEEMPTQEPTALIDTSSVPVVADSPQPEADEPESSEDLPLISAETAPLLAPGLNLQDGSDFIYDLAFSPDGRQLAVGTTAREVHIWDTASGERIATLNGHTSRVTSVDYSPDGTLLATGSQDKTIILWDTATWTDVHRFEEHENFIGMVAFSPDGRLLAAGGHPVHVWDVASGELVFTLEGSALTLLDLAFSPDGTWLAAAHGDAELDLWSMETGEQVASFTGESTISRTAFSTSGLLAGASSSISSATGEPLGHALVWNPLNGETVAASQEKMEVLDVAFSLDESLLIVSVWSENAIQLVRMPGGTVARALQEHASPIYAMTLSADGTLLASSDTSGHIIIWSVPGQP